MDVDVTESRAHQAVLLDELQDLLVFCLSGQGKKLQVREDFKPVFEIAAGQFADNERVAQHLPILQQPFQVRDAFPEMADPDRSVYQNHIYRTATLRLGTAFKCLSVPPSFASRRALSLAIRASSPSFTNVVFSLMPVNSDALSSNPSSMFNVVLIALYLSS
jgi:hypothetical protein